MVHAPKQVRRRLHPQWLRAIVICGSESGEAGLGPVAVGFIQQARLKRRRCTQRDRANGANELGRRTGPWLLGGVTGGLPPVSINTSSPMEGNSKRVSLVFIQAGGYGGRHAPAVHPNCDVSRLGPTLEVSWRRRQATKPKPQKMYTVPVAGAWWLDVGCRLERRVGPRCARVVCGR